MIRSRENMVPNDPASPFITSGLRLGTPAITTRGFKEEQVERVAHVIADVLGDWKNDAIVSEAKKQMLTLCQQFPVY